MKIEILNNYRTDENCYLVYDEKTGNGFVIDPGYSAEGILSAAEKAGVTIRYILLTHCHYDHIQYTPELLEASGAALISGEKGRINCADPDINMTAYALEHPISLCVDKALSDGEELVLDGLTCRCIETPGHTNCSVCYLINGVLFCGDTLFLRNVGRWDLPTGNEEQLRQSIQKKLYVLDKDVKAYPGHGGATSIGYEKKFNFYVKG